MNGRASTTIDRQPNDNRLDRRYRLNLPLTYSLFSSTHNPSFEAVACNSSQRGLCFRSAVPLMQGQYICVRPGRVDPDATAGDRPPATVKALGLAQVRWCLSEPSVPTAAYTVGIQYL